jgi:ADP-heptose:LPS heptosyltransferase
MQEDRPTLLSHPNILNFGEEIGDFSDTAALCSLMDVVISVDTSVVHVSGALGTPTWVLLAECPDWRWLLGREDSPRYDSVRLYRQDVRGDWTNVFAKISADLMKWNNKNSG